jgi:hypothetical protein
MVCYHLSEAESSLFKEFVGTNFDAIPAIKSTESSAVLYFIGVGLFQNPPSTFKTLL